MYVGTGGSGIETISVIPYRNMTLLYKLMYVSDT